MTKKEVEDLYINWFSGNASPEEFISSVTSLFASGVSTKMMLENKKEAEIKIDFENEILNITAVLDKKIKHKL